MTPSYTLDNIVGAVLPVAADRQYLVQTRSLRMARGILDQVGRIARQQLQSGHLLLVSDDHVFPLFGAQVVRSLEQAGFTVHPLLLPDGHDGKVEADEEGAARVEQAIDALPAPRAGLVALGSGTVNDLAKLPAYNKGLTYGVVATAASMNGYTSAIAAILAGGVKRTLPCAPPVFVVADMDLIASAPLEMTRAGLGDLLSKPVSSGDWRLSSLLLGEPFHVLPVRLVEDAYRRTQAVAVGIGSGDPESIGPLMEALLLSGISMASAGSSSPASGGEHLLSHLWDMTAPYRGRMVGLHGAQVGVSTLVTATLYQHLRQHRPTRKSVDRLLEGYLPFSDYTARLSGLPEALIPAIQAESRRKYPSQDVLRHRLEGLVDQWDILWEDLGGYLQSPRDLRKVLVEAGAPVTAGQLGIPAREMREAYRLARDIRSRYTVLDLAWELGVLDELEDTVLEESGVLAAGGSSG